MNKYTTLLILTICIVACKSPSYISKPSAFKHHTKGLLFDYQLRFKDQKRAEGIGEIIEVDSTSITLLSVKPPFKLNVFSRESIESADIIVALTSEEPENISLIAGLINLIPITHGFYAAITIPINLIFTISIANDAATGTYKLRDYKWEDIPKFARFPQGIPQHIKPEDIR